VLHGDEDFLKRQVLAALRTVAFGADGSDFGLSTHDGDKATLAEVCDELETLPFLASCRLVVVENADPFVTRYRAALEKYLAQPPSRTGTLVLSVKTWQSTTRLAKLLDNAATIACKAPAKYKVPDWCIRWADSHYGKQLSAPAAQLLVELVGLDMGLLDQELAKLAVYAGAAARIDAGDVDRLVGRSREENTFKIFDAIGGGSTAEALTLLDRLFDQGEDALRILGAFSWQLRRLAQVDRLCRQGRGLAAAMEEAGVHSFARQGCEQQLRHLGRRADHLYDWLLEVDLGIKGSSQLAPRVLLERLVVRLAAGEGERRGVSPTWKSPPSVTPTASVEVSARRGGRHPP
jgi:DNA polymerase-3 subunit delta